MSAVNSNMTKDDWPWEADESSALQPCFVPSPSAPLKYFAERYPPKDAALLTDFEKCYPLDPCVFAAK